MFSISLKYLYMAIELTTASLSAQIGINNALRTTFASGIPSLDGFVPNGGIYCFCDALEGSAVPDGASATYTKTYNLSADIPWGYILFAANSGAPVDNVATSNLAIRSTYFGTLTASYDSGAAQGPEITSVLDQARRVSLFVNHDYTDAKTLYNVADANRDKNEDGSSRSNTFLKTYTQLGNTLVGYYGGQSNVGYVQRQASSVLKSAWLDGQNLVMSFKKYASTSGVTFNDEKFCVFW